MKKFLRISLALLIMASMLISSFGVVAFAAAAQNGSTSSASDNQTETVEEISHFLADLVEAYKGANPGVAEHQITAEHVLVYDDDAYFKDNVNATTSIFSCYSKLGADALAEALGKRDITVALVSDKTAANGKEILVGKVDRSAETAILSELDFNEYGIFVTEDNIILFAWSDAALRVCVEHLVDYLATATSLPVGFEFVGVADDGWKADFVRPDNAVLSASQYLNDNSVQLLYTGTGATKAGYSAYCAKLASDGFVSVWTNTIGNNEFGMYKNTAKDIVLYVAYNDFTYSSEYVAKYTANYTVDTNAYLPMGFEKCIRVVTSPLSETVLPEEVNTKQSYTKITDSYLTTLGIDEGFVGSGHIITLEDGRFILVDGGNCKCKGESWCTHVNLIWDSLMSLYKKIHGHEPTAEEPIHLAAWYLTHAHGDHVNALYYMLKLIDADEEKKAIFKLDYLIMNIPGADALFKNTSTTWGHSASFETFKTFLGGTELIKPYAGQKLHFANVTIEVLMTFGDHLPRVINNTNDTNTITRFHVQSGENSSTSIMFLGDSWRGASRYLCAQYGPYLKSDISQISHHGNIGAEKELYETIAPKCILFNNTLSMFKTYAWGNATSKNPEIKHAYAVDRFVVRELESVNYAITAVSGKTPTFKITADGAQYDAAFNLKTGFAIIYKSAADSQRNQTGFLRRGVTDYHVHSYTAVYLDEGSHRYECECGVIMSPVKVEAHTPEADDNDCTTPTRCTGCAHVMVEAVVHELDADGKCKNCAVLIPPETTPAETNPAETNPAETNPAETTPSDTTPPATDTAEPDKKGCGGTVSVAAVALVASLGACAVFVEKKRR